MQKQPSHYFLSSKALVYKKCGKYNRVNEREGFVDIFFEITGLQVSSGLVIFRENAKSAVFLDSRYTLAAKTFIDQEKFEILGYSMFEMLRWICCNLNEDTTLAYDPRFFSKCDIEEIQLQLGAYKFEQVDVESKLNLEKARKDVLIEYIDADPSANKMSAIYETIKTNNLDAYLLANPCSISWTLDIRDFNSKYTPVVFGYLLVTKDREHVLYLDEMYNDVFAPLNFQIKTRPEREIIDDLKHFSSVGIDMTETASHIVGDNLVAVKNPCILLQSIKNAIEVSGMKEAAKKDSAAIINFLYWIYNLDNQKTTELDIVEKMQYFRQQQDGFIGDSFSCIAAADAHSAILHYSPTERSNSVIDNILLLDSGGQYNCGTTDITRTICIKTPTAEHKKFYTLVLKGHIALAGAKFSPACTGVELDAIARQFLLRHNVDYGHGTGHGIGYISHVHEGSVSISKNCHEPLKTGMIMSNEPGYYKDNEFGIRLENMMLVKAEADGESLVFEVMSFIPFDVKLIDEHLLTDDEKQWIKAYHEDVLREMRSRLSGNVLSWLSRLPIFK